MQEQAVEAINQNQQHLVGTLKEIQRRMGYGMDAPGRSTSLEDVAWSINQMAFILTRMVRDDSMANLVKAAQLPKSAT